MTDAVTPPPNPTSPPGHDEPVRAVFRRALRDMLVLVAGLAVVGVALGALISEPPSAGILGALIGVVLTLLFSGTTVVSMLRTTSAAPSAMMATILGAWLVKMIVLIVILSVLKDQTFYDRTVLVGVLLAGVVGSIYLDYRAVVRGRVPYVQPGPATQG